jgi:hypothetical protein
MKTIATSFCFIGSLLLSPHLSAEIVSINFPGNAGAAGTLTADDEAGVNPVMNWNNVTTSGQNLINSAGEGSAIRVVYTVRGWSNSLLEAEDAESRLMKGYLDIGGTNTTTITLQNLDPARSYRIYLYSDGENSNVDEPLSRTGTFELSDVSTGVTDTAGEQFRGTFHRVYPGTTGEGNFTDFTVSGSASYEILAKGTAADIDNVYRAPLNAIQIVEVSND